MPRPAAYKTWTQRDGTVIKIRKMTDQHLINTIKMLKRNKRHRASDRFVPGLAALKLMGPEPNPDTIASDHFSDMIDEIFEDGGMTVTVPACPQYRDLVAEAKYRKLKLD